VLYFTDDCKIFQANLVGQLWGLAPEHPRRYPNLNPHTAGIHRVATGHLPGKQVREFKSGQGKSGKVCSCIWSITASIDLDTKCAKNLGPSTQSWVVLTLLVEQQEGHPACNKHLPDLLF